jgi:hypothetical protein
MLVVAERARHFPQKLALGSEQAAGSPARHRQCEASKNQAAPRVLPDE